MEYSTADIAAARSLQLTKYIHMSMVTFWIYDYACLLHEEWTFLLRSHWNKMKGLYIVTRYLPFIILATDIYRGFTPNENADKCLVLDNAELGLNLVLVIFSEWFFILRTYVLWNNNRILLAAMLYAFFTFIGASTGLTFATTAPATCTHSHLLSGVPRPLKHSVHFHRSD
ncbi:uncharacterized protein F5891DRAFT_655644 [Suillus fuscotomentosus]|uniref:DUF6533 domain-containing protein n=1 Tax=Suillus fuscotomentosus TaxID=1912939 RepID=A0AAD4DXD8_9AGAM|nr:uncharacterized protein F5891DRAFT_655644 [Suillus fuscotomentosus]KAG1895640.1 hypothetical protein F5891DRAFT_655644 [Suillus fuscotomentosus]